MKKMINLSKRLEKAASYLPEGSLFADIGSDHAHLPCYICLADPTARAIAGEVNEGPYSNAAKTVKNYNLEDRIAVRLGNGLEVIQQGEINELVITGMGGTLIRSILESGKNKLVGVNRIIAQPNNEAATLRKWLDLHSYTIMDEDILEENGHTYEILMAEHQKKHYPLTEKEILFGPVLMRRQSAVFIRKWEQEFQKYKRIIENMKMAQVPNEEKIQHFNEKMNLIKEVIRFEE